MSFFALLMDHTVAGLTERSMMAAIRKELLRRRSKEGEIGSCLRPWLGQGPINICTASSLLHMLDVECSREEIKNISENIIIFRKYQIQVVVRNTVDQNLWKIQLTFLRNTVTGEVIQIFCDRQKGRSAGIAYSSSCIFKPSHPEVAILSPFNDKYTNWDRVY